jgi:hypothetical protein
LDGTVALKRIDSFAEQELDAVPGVDIPVELADLATEDPLCRAEAATSEPIQPAPTTATRPPTSSRSRSESQSDSVRR